MSQRSTDRLVRDLITLFQRLRELTAEVHTPEFLSLDVTMQQAKALYIVQGDPGIRMSALAGRLRIGLSTVSGTIDRLSDMGLVRRNDDPNDRRHVVVSLTEKGTEVMERFHELGEALLRDLLGSLDRDELSGLRRGVLGFVRVLEQRRISSDGPSGRAEAPPTVTT